jgi:hypothetical protein
MESGGILHNQGTLVLKKNLENQNSDTNSLGTGSIVFSGSLNQSIFGQNVIQNMEVNNPSGLTIEGNTRVNGILSLTSGVIGLGSQHFILGSAATITGVPSAANMVDATGTGQLQKEFPAGFTGSFTFPVGDQTGTPEYSPATLNFTGGTFPSGSYIGITLANNKYPDTTITGNYLNRYWTLSRSGITGFTCSAVFQYTAADVTGTENMLSCTKVNPLPWVTYGLTNATTHQLAATGITAFSSFTGLKSTTTPFNQELTNIIIPGGVSNCYDAVQVLTVAGNGNTFIVEDHGIVTLVAGSSISILPGATVNAGGYLHGYITTTTIYCGSMFNPLVENPVRGEMETTEYVQHSEFKWIRIFPNPTTDFIVLELSQTETPVSAYVAIYNMNGQQILHQTMNGENKKQFSLSGQPKGIYMVHVRLKERSEITKIIKN